jgi:hypothetical protein
MEKLEVRPKNFKYFEKALEPKNPNKPHKKQAKAQRTHSRNTDQNKPPQTTKTQSPSFTAD